MAARVIADKFYFSSSSPSLDIIGIGAIDYEDVLVEKWLSSEDGLGTRRHQNNLLVFGVEYQTATEAPVVIPIAYRTARAAKIFSNNLLVFRPYWLHNQQLQARRAR